MKIYAHRGSSLLWPENTLLAFNHAHEAGATGFETDLRLSKNGEIILSHDDALHRFGKPQKIISKLAAEEIIHTKISSRDAGLQDHLITLKTLLKAFPNKDYIFDCKISDRQLFESLKQLLDDLKFHNRIWFLTWDAAGDRHVKEIFPGCDFFPRVPRSYAWGVGTLLGLNRLFEPDNTILSLPAYHFGLPVFSARQISSIQSRGKTFVGYLINSEKDARRCRECGINIILTDRPDLFSRTLVEN
ncbi:MAG TPA: glycerophosphodiester phosphodiesterase family protein [bacterium]